MNGIRDHKKMLCIFLSLVCCLTLFIVPSFASGTDIASIPVATSSDSSELFQVGDYIYYGVSEGEFYYFYRVSGGTRYLQFCSSENLGSITVYYYNSKFSHGGSYNLNVSLYNDTYDIYYGSLTVDSGSVSNYNFYDTYLYDDLESGLSAVRDFIDNGGSSLPTGSSGQVVIPAGWVSYIQVSGGNILLETTFPEYSKIVVSPPWDSRSTIQFGVSDLPSEGTVFSESSGTLINWSKSVDGRNLLGQTKLAGYGVNNLEQSDNYIVIYNPAHRQVSSTGQGDVSPTIYVTCSELIIAKSYALSETLDLTNGQTTSTSTDGYSNSNAITTTPDGSTDSEGNPATPNVGGSGADASYNDWTINTYLQNIKETLDNFANNFIGLLKSPISHVQQLISAGTDYFSMIRGLYAWLPDNVQSTLESAMIVSLSIGVIGLLL